MFVPGILDKRVEARADAEAGLEADLELDAYVGSRMVKRFRNR